MPLPISIQVRVFDSGGELVATLFTGYSEMQPTGARLSSPLLLLGAPPVRVLFPGPLSGGASSVPWAGLDSRGQAVQDGLYTISIQTHDPFGVFSSWSLPVSVLSPAGQSSLKVFDSAGEQVGQVDLAPFPGRIADFRLPQPSVALAPGASPPSVPLVLVDQSGNTFAASWNPVNPQGQCLASGLYHVQLAEDLPGDGNVISRDLTLVDAPARLPSALLAPNPAGADGRAWLCYPARPGMSARAQVYDLAGERVGAAADPTGSGRMEIDLAGKPSGIYLVEWQLWRDGAVLGRGGGKLAVVK